MFEQSIGYLELSMLNDGIRAINQASSEQDIGLQIGRICQSVLPCGWGGVGLINKEGDSILTTTGFASESNHPHTLSDKDLPKWATYGNELVKNWLKVRHFLFVDNLQCGVRPLNGSIQPENIIFDVIEAGETAQGCYYYLVNIDKALLSKYQIVMKLLLSSIHATLIRVTKIPEFRTDEITHLTEREQEIIFRIRSGLNNKSIANQLNISVNTVKCHIYNIFQKLQATNRVDALVKAEKAGYLN